MPQCVPFYVSSPHPTDHGGRLRTSLPLSLPFLWKPGFVPAQRPTCFSPLASKPPLYTAELKLRPQGPSGCALAALTLVSFSLTVLCHKGFLAFPQTCWSRSCLSLCTWCSLCLIDVFCSRCINCWHTPSFHSSFSLNVTTEGSERPSMTSQAKEVPLSLSTSYSAILFCTYHQVA